MEWYFSGPFSPPFAGKSFDTCSQGTRIGNPHQLRKTLEAVDEEAVQMLTKIRESERNYEKEDAEARTRDQQAKAARQSNRSEFNYITPNSNTPIKNTGTTAFQSEGNQNQYTERNIHFNPNLVHHLYPMTGSTSQNSQYKPPVNDSIIQGAGTAPGGQFATNATSATGHNEAWRNNNRTNATSHTNPPPHTTRPTGHNGFFNDSPNSSGNRNSRTCFKYGEQGHMRHECRAEREYCTPCRSPNHDVRACRRFHNNTPSPTNSHIPTGYHLTATPPLLSENAPNTGAQPQQTGTTNNGLWFQNYLDTNQPRTSTTIHTPFMNNMS